MKFYKVVVYRGHMGYEHPDTTITFYERANNILEAISKAQKHGGVKHSKPPLSVEEISYQEFQANKNTNAYEKAGCKKTGRFCFRIGY